MKKFNFIFIPTKDRELIFLVILFFAFFKMVCLTARNFNVSYSRFPTVKLAHIYDDQYGNFDQVKMPNNPPVIAKMISVLKPNFSLEKRNEVATKISHALKKYKIEPQIVVAIIDAESDFNHAMVSSTGDLSMAQVNVDIWNKEFARMNLNLIEPEKLKADEAYSLEVMAQILSILKSRYEKKDRRWYARYHSKTKKHKREYLSKLNTRMKLLEKSKLLASR